MHTDPIADAIATLPCPVEIYTGPDRFRVYDDRDRRISIPELSVGAHDELRDRGIAPAGAWREASHRFGDKALEVWLEDGGHDAGCAVIEAACEARMLSGSAVTLAALLTIGELHPAPHATIDLWLVKWGYEAFVFRCTVTEPTGSTVYALNVARDLTEAAPCVDEAAQALAEDYARAPHYVVRPYGLHRAQLSPTAVCPVLVTEWAQHPETHADLQELHVYADCGPRFFLWDGQRESRNSPLSAEASRNVWKAAIRNLAIYSDGRQADQLGIGAGDLVGDGETIKKVWSRKIRVPAPWLSAAMALLAHATDGDQAVFFDDPGAAVEAFMVPGAAAPITALRALRPLVASVAGRQLVALAVLGAASPLACQVLERASAYLTSFAQEMPGQPGDAS